MRVIREELNRITGLYFFGSKPGDYRWTVFTKYPTCKRGEYAEEIDVATWGRFPGEARRVAQAALDADYELDLRISRIEKIW